MLADSRYPLPRIKCAVCHKIKAVNFFSTIQQNTLRNAIAIGDVRDATVEEWVPCVSCTPKQVTELECCICGEVKGLEGFAKAQRRLGEEAVCNTSLLWIPRRGSDCRRALRETSRNDIR